MPYVIEGGFSTKDGEKAFEKVRKVCPHAFPFRPMNEVSAKDAPKKEEVKEEPQAKKKSKWDYNSLKALTRKEQEKVLDELGVGKSLYRKYKEDGLIKLILGRLKGGK